MKAPEMPDAMLERKPLLIILVKRVSILLLILFLLALFFWTVGSLRSFLEETQLMILELLRWASLGLVLCSCLGALLALSYALARRRGAAVAGFLGYLLLAAFGALGLLLSSGLAALNRGLP